MGSPSDVAGKRSTTVERQPIGRGDVDDAPSVPGAYATARTSEIPKMTSPNGLDSLKASSKAEPSAPLDPSHRNSPSDFSVPASSLQTKRLRSAPTSIPDRGSSISPATSPITIQEADPLDLAVEETKSSETARINRVSRHVREGALSQVDSGGDAPDIAAPSPEVETSPDSFRKWKQTMEGMLDGKRVEEDLPRELGIPVANLGAFDPSTDVPSGDSGKPKPTQANVGSGQLVDSAKVRNHFKGSGSTAQSAIAKDNNFSATDKPISTSAPLSRLNSSPTSNVAIAQEQSKSSLDAPTHPLRSDRTCIQPQSRDGHSGASDLSAQVSDHSFKATGTDFLPKEADDPELYGKMMATQIFDEDETHVRKGDVAAYLGGL